MKEESPAKNTAAQPAANAAEVLEVWAADLVGNIPQLRETDAYNKFRSAIGDLKNKLQP